MNTGLKTTLLVGALCVAATAHAQSADTIAGARKALVGHHPEQAIKALDPVLAKQPDNVEARFLKGLALAREHKTFEAVTLFEKLTSDRPHMAEAWNNLGVLYARSGALARARSVLEKAVHLDASYGFAQENLGDVYVALAESAYDTAGKLEPDDSAVRLKGARLYSVLKHSSGNASVPDSGSAVTGGDKRDNVDALTATGPGVPTSSKSNGGQPGQDETAQASQSQMPTADSSAPIESAVRSALRTWAQAWSNQNLPAYMNAYSDNYEPANGQSLADWIKRQRQHVKSPGHIEVNLSDIQVTPEGSDKAVATFDQQYKSDDHAGDEHKTATLIREDGGWRIKRES